MVHAGMTCDSTETSLLHCPSMGWNNVHVVCAGHDSDAGVLCKRNGEVTLRFYLLLWSKRKIESGKKRKFLIYILYYYIYITYIQ